MGVWDHVGSEDHRPCLLSLGPRQRRETPLRCLSRRAPRRHAGPRGSGSCGRGPLPAAGGGGSVALMPPSLHLLSAHPHTQRQGWEGADFEARPAQVRSQPGRLPAADTLRLSVFSCGWGAGRGTAVSLRHPMRPLLWAPLAAHGPPSPGRRCSGCTLLPRRAASSMETVQPTGPGARLRRLRCEG